MNDRLLLSVAANGNVWIKSGFTRVAPETKDADYIALPAAQHAAREKVVEAAGALLAEAVNGSCFGGGARWNEVVAALKSALAQGGR